MAKTRSINDDPEEMLTVTGPDRISAEDAGGITPAPAPVVKRAPPIMASAPPAVHVHDPVPVAPPADLSRIDGIFDKLGRVRLDWSDAQIEALTEPQKEKWGALLATSLDERAADQEYAAANSAVSAGMRNETIARDTAAKLRTGYTEEKISAGDQAILLDVTANPADRAGAMSRASAVAHKNRMAMVQVRETDRLREIRRSFRHNGAPVDPAIAKADAETEAARSALIGQADQIIAEADEVLQTARARLVVATETRKRTRAAVSLAVSDWLRVFAPITHEDLVRTMGRQTQAHLAAVASGDVPAEPVPARPLWPIERKLMNRPRPRPETF